MYYSDIKFIITYCIICFLSDRFWCGMYCRFDNNVQPRENIEDVVARVKNHTISLEDHVMWLTDVSNS